MFPSNTHVPELKQLVKESMEQEGREPPVIGPVGGPTENITNVIILLVAMMAHIMGSSHVSHVHQMSAC